MKIRVSLGIAAAVGAILASSLGDLAEGQVGLGTQNPFGADGPFNPFNAGGMAQNRMPPQGTWAEIVNVTARWIVVQNQAGQQFPIASDRVRQFLVRWPYTTEQVNGGSMIEVSGPDAGSNTIIADHLDVYENEAQSLVSPTLNVLSSANRALTPFDIDQMNSYGSNFWITPEENAMPARVHLVGRATPDPTALRISAGNANWYTIQPSANGMSVTQVTLGSNSYARRGDVVYVVPENLGPRSVDVSQLVLYKRIPLRAFQP